VAREKLFERHGDFDPSDPKSLLRWAKSLRGRTLRDSLQSLPGKSQEVIRREIARRAKAEILPDGTYKGPKGMLGLLTEMIHFGLAPDIAAEADLREAGLELKVTGLIKNNRGIRAKERLSLGMIDYKKCLSLGRSFEDDREIQKSLNGLLMMTYWYNGRVTNPLDLVFHDSFIWKPIGAERRLLKNDWAFIQSCIRTGHAHMLSERYASALGAPPKGAGSDSDFQPQPVRVPYNYQQTEETFTSMGVEEDQATYAAEDFRERSKKPGNSTKGYALPKNKELTKAIGPFPARRRCYSLTNSYLTKLIRANIEE
jgi:DNA mismatch repair protein MutH